MHIRFSPPVPAVYHGPLSEYHGGASVNELCPDGSFILTTASGAKLRGVRPRSFTSVGTGTVDYRRTPDREVLVSQDIGAITDMIRQMTEGMKAAANPRRILS